MTIPVQITFRHMESSAAVETCVRELADHLGVFSDRIQGCRVVVDSPHRHQHQGKVFNGKVQLVSVIRAENDLQAAHDNLKNVLAMDLSQKIAAVDEPTTIVYRFSEGKSLAPAYEQPPEMKSRSEM